MFTEEKDPRVPITALGSDLGEGINRSPVAKHDES
jgi:hypothetical protein